jgi:hypothetical protein
MNKFNSSLVLAASSFSVSGGRSCLLPSDLNQQIKFQK